jgi:hypothetical protein
MAIATTGIIDQEWADLLKSWIAGDRYVDYYIEARNLGVNLPVDSEDIEKIRQEYRYIDTITGLRFRETSNEDAADIYIAQVDRSFFAADAASETLGETSIENDGTRDYFMVLYYDQAYDNSVIRHEIGHTLGLDHPYGDGFNPLYNHDDTMMSYNNNSTNKMTITDSDIAALKYLWGEAGTNYDAEIARPATPDTPSSPSVDGFSYNELGKLTQSWKNGANKSRIRPEGSSKKVIGTDDDDNLNFWGDTKGYLIDARGGNDVIGGSKSKDKIYGGRGSDFISLPKGGKKDKDKIYLEKTSSPYQADVLRGLEKYDRIFITGGSGQISVNAIDGGLGIYDGDNLCGIYISKDLNAAALAGMVSSI